MALRDFFSTTKCKSCKEHLEERFCVRIGKKICWRCCNKKRIDFQCSDTCPYHLKEKYNEAHEAKADSQTEFVELMQLVMRKYLRTENDALDGKVPMDLKYEPTQKQTLIDFVNSLPVQPFISKNFLRKELDLKIVANESEIFNPETVAQAFLLLLLEQNFEEAAKKMVNRKYYEKEEYLENFINRMSALKTLSKIEQFSIVKSGMSENRKELAVQFEINMKSNLTIHLVDIAGLWFVKEFFFEAIEFSKSEENFIGQIVSFLQKNELGNAENALKRAMKIFPNSADFHYYYGIIYSLREDRKKAKPYFFNAIEIDPKFDEAIYNYAFMLHAEDEKEKAKKLYNSVLELNKNHVKANNNLAVLLEEEGNVKDALKHFKICLKLDPEFEFAKKNIERITNGKV